jgi:hypothetical protein
MKNFNHDTYINPIEELMLNDLYDLYSDDLDDQLEIKAGSLEHLKVNLLNAIVDYMKAIQHIEAKMPLIRQDLEICFAISPPGP